MGKGVPPIRRRGALRDPKRRSTLLCEGRNTEPEYFKAVKLECAGALIEIKTRGGVGVPVSIADAAIKLAESLGLAKRGRKKNSFEEKDEVWAVFDRDEHDRFSEAVDRCEAHGVRVARSNPCFELWLILHEADYDKPGNRKEVQRKLQQLRPEYDRRGRKVPDCREMVARVEEAEKRAEVLLARREEEGNPFGPPSTTVGKLTTAIREAARLSGK